MLGLMEGMVRNEEIGMKLFIQYMVSLRCKLLVRSELNKRGIPYHAVELGEVWLNRPLTSEEHSDLSAALHRSGLELMDDRNAILIEKIIHVVIENVHYSEDEPLVNFSDVLAEKLNMNYHRMSELFSKTKGVTIEKFVILHKVERIKELLIYDELNIAEIADRMHYSSAAHLSKQFKQVTGLTPSFFKHALVRKRRNHEDLP
jgi:AraC-like DNA-binding protein